MPEQYKSAGFPRSARLLGSKDFGRVFDDARPFGGPQFTILARRNDLQQARLGIVIGKKKVRRSVDRNLMKRIIRESFRQARGRLPAVDLVVIARPLKSVDNNALRASLEKQWRRIGKAFDTQE